MFWMMNGMGPRGPVHGHRGFDRGFGPRVRRPMGMLGGFGLGGLFLLPVLLFGGWMIAAVVCGIIGVVIMILGSVFSGISSLAAGVFSGIGSVGTVAVGILIGLALISRLKGRNGNTEEAGVDAETDHD